MKISFVIPAYNEEKNIGRCLQTILQQIAENHCEAEVIVVDNNSTDKTIEMARSYKGVMVLEEKKKGPNFARQAGFLASSGDLVANVDADSMPAPGWLAKVISEFESNQNLVGLSGPYVYYDLPWTLNFFVHIQYYVAYCVYLLHNFVLRINSMATFGNLIIRRSALQKLGGYDLSVEFYGDDTDIALRLFPLGKVKFALGLQMYSSGRRLQSEGIMRAEAKYIINYFWITYKKRPFTKSYSDIRISNTNK